MAAIIRRHRFLIIFILCFSLLMLFSWHFHKREGSILNIIPVMYLNENFNNDIKIPESSIPNVYLTDKTKVSDSVKPNLPQLINIHELPEYEESLSFVQTKNTKESTRYRVEEDFIPTKQVNVKFTTKFIGQHEENLVKGTEDSPKADVIRNLSKDFFSPSKFGFSADNKIIDLKESSFVVPNSKKFVWLSAVLQNEEGFILPHQENKWTKIEDVTISVQKQQSSNRTDAINLSSKNIHSLVNQQELLSIKSNISNTSKNPSLLIDTLGCKIPKLDPWDPTVRHLIHLQDPYTCPGPPIFMESNPGGAIILNKTILETYYNTTTEGLICTYLPIYRKHETWKPREEAYAYGIKTELEFGMPLNEDYIVVSCHINEKRYDQYFPLVRLKKEVEEKRSSLVPPNPKLNVILIGIDSVSKLNFLRHFPRTHAFINEKLNPFEMNGYTKVGDNTFPNLVPMLTGQFVDYWWNETVADTMFFDNISLIWREYAKKGYRTFYAEDNPLAGTFNYLKRGFNNPPTDYYFRPLALPLHFWKELHKPEKEFCLSFQTDTDMIYKYLNNFVQTMGTRPYFGFAMVSTITHDKLNYAGWADEPTERLLDGLYSTGALNNTLLVLFSDHGLRYGKIRHTFVGKFEERLPLMYIYLPKWFLKQYPEIAKNMQINQNRLMTLFDIHATMLHLLDFRKNQGKIPRRTQGNSLFEEISPNRTCYDANIETHFCPCQEFVVVDKNSPEVLNASWAIMQDINSKLQPYNGICEVLEVHAILDARVSKVNDLMLQYVGSENEVINKTIYISDEPPLLSDYMITLVTKPGGAVFEGTVRHNVDMNRFRVLGLSRISLYGNTSWCIKSQRMKLFCYCKIQQHK